MKKKQFWIFLSALIVVNLTGLFNGLFLGDSALYACISKSFVTSGNWLDIFVKGHDWLDKPHFPFWLCAASMKIFGINAFAYKLPSVLMFFLSLFYTYKLAEVFYNKKTARLSSLILASAVHIMISYNDTRAEAMLLPLIIGAVYHMYILTKRFSFSHLTLAALLSACAVMTKGIFVLIIIFSAIFAHLWIKSRFEKIWKWKWIFLLVLIGIFIIPELYAVYVQFDLHPEKIVFGKTGVSGLRFFFWDSQFGRFVNSGPIKGHGDPLFFLHTIVWAFAPWALVGYMALFESIRKVVRSRKITEYVTLFGFLVMFVIFSISSFQLPHYTNILFPFLSIICGKYIIKHIKKHWFRRIIKATQWVYTISYILVLGLIIYFFRLGHKDFTIMLVLLTILAIVYMHKQFASIVYRSIYTSLIVTMMFLLYANIAFYPTLLKYQNASQAAEYVNQHFTKNTIVNEVQDPLFEFEVKNKVIYQGNNIDKLKSSDENEKILYYANEEFIKSLRENGIGYKRIECFHGFHITKLKKEFFYYKTRNKSLNATYLIKLTTNEIKTQ